jgi:hypothetical protein
VDERELLHAAADYAADFLETLDDRPIRHEADVGELYEALGGTLPEDGLEPRVVLASLVEAAEPGLVGSPSGRYFGFVVGGGVPAALAGEQIRRVIERVQEDGTRGTEWGDEHAMRISVSNWRTTREDVERATDAILSAASVPA